RRKLAALSMVFMDKWPYFFLHSPSSSGVNVHLPRSRASKAHPFVWLMLMCYFFFFTERTRFSPIVLYILSIHLLIPTLFASSIMLRVPRLLPSHTHTK